MSRAGQTERREEKRREEKRKEEKNRREAREGKSRECRLRGSIAAPNAKHGTINFHQLVLVSYRNVIPTARRDKEDIMRPVNSTLSPGLAATRPCLRWKVPPPPKPPNGAIGILRGTGPGYAQSRTLVGYCPN